jgi:hypothetical protein
MNNVNCENCRYSKAWDADMPCIGCFDYARWDTPDGLEHVIPPSDKADGVRPDTKKEILDFANASIRWKEV